MTILRKVARALHQSGVANPSWEDWLPSADAAIDAFLIVAAEEGWHMRPDEATEEMLNACPQAQSRSNVGRDRYRAMQSAAPDFEWK